eukprot:36916-Eustigmatos_ZCMA.PRE.1
MTDTFYIIPECATLRVQELVCVNHAPGAETSYMTAMICSHISLNVRVRTMSQRRVSVDAS